MLLFQVRAPSATSAVCSVVLKPRRVFPGVHDQRAQPDESGRCAARRIRPAPAAGRLPAGDYPRRVPALAAARRDPPAAQSPSQVRPSLALRFRPIDHSLITGVWRHSKIGARPARITSAELGSYQLFHESPEQQRADGGTAAQVPEDSWVRLTPAESRQGIDYFPSGRPGARIGVRKRFGRVVRSGLPPLRYFEFSLLRVRRHSQPFSPQDRSPPASAVAEEDSVSVFQVFTEADSTIAVRPHPEPNTNLTLT